MINYVLYLHNNISLHRKKQIVWHYKLWVPLRWAHLPRRRSLLVWLTFTLSQSKLALFLRKQIPFKTKKATKGEVTKIGMVVKQVTE